MRFNIAANTGVPIQVVDSALGATECKVVIETDSRDRGGTRVMPAPSDLVNGAALVECRTLISVLHEKNITSIDALKIDVEGNEDEILLPFFREAEPSLWPRLIIIEDTHDLWREDLFSALIDYGYFVSTRSKLNVMMRLR